MGLLDILRRGKLASKKRTGYAARLSSTVSFQAGLRRVQGLDTAILDR
jgi:hypothetical protein